MKSQTPKETKLITEDFKRSKPLGNVSNIEDRKAAQADRHWPSNLEGQEQDEESEDVGQTRTFAKKPETNVEQRTARHA